MAQKHVSVLVPVGDASLGCINGPFILFGKTNEFLARLGKDSMFTVQFVGLSNVPQVYDRVFSVNPDITIHDLQHTDLIIIPAVNGNMKKVIEANKDFLPWIVAMHSKGAVVVVVVKKGNAAAGRLKQIFVAMLAAENCFYV